MQSTIRLGSPAIAAWIASQHPQTRPIMSTPRREPECPDARAAMRAIDNPRPKEPKTLDANLTDEQRSQLVEHRGGCSCFIRPPCSACCSPLSADEAACLFDFEETAESVERQTETWFGHEGGICPVPAGTMLFLLFRDGHELGPVEALGDDLHNRGDYSRGACAAYWKRHDCPNDIVAYRLA